VPKKNGRLRPIGKGVFRLRRIEKGSYYFFAYGNLEKNGASKIVLALGEKRRATFFWLAAKDAALLQPRVALRATSLAGGCCAKRLF